MKSKKELTFLDEASIEFECRFFGERYSIKDAWRKYGQKHKDYNSLAILEFGKKRLDKQLTCLQKILSGLRNTSYHSYRGMVT